MKKVLFLLLVLPALIGVSPCHATDSAVVTSYAEAVSKVQSSLRPPSDEVERSPTTPPHLLRFNLDVTGDGVEELFLANNLFSEHLLNWTVYRKEKNEWQVASTQVWLNPRSFYRETTERGITLLGYERDPSDQYQIIGYAFDREGRATYAGRQLSEADRAAIRSGTAGRQRYGLRNPIAPGVKIQEVSLALKDPSASWLDYNPDQAPASQYVSDYDLSQKVSPLPDYDLQAQTPNRSLAASAPQTLPEADVPSRSLPPKEETLPAPTTEARPVSPLPFLLTAVIAAGILLCLHRIRRHA